MDFYFKGIMLPEKECPAFYGNRIHVLLNGYVVGDQSRTN